MVNVHWCKFFGRVRILTFVIVRIFWSYSNPNLVILIGSCELASFESVLALLYNVNIFFRELALKTFNVFSQMGLQLGYLQA